MLEKSKSVQRLWWWYSLLKKKKKKKKREISTSFFPFEKRVIN